MLINSIKSQSTVRFGENHKITKYGCHQTHLFREDINWDFLAKLIISKFDKSKIYCYASSDGSEAYSLEIMLKNNKAELKNYPIIAKDINPKLIKQSNNAIVGISDKSTDQMVLQSIKNKYFVYTNSPIYKSERGYDKLGNPIRFTTHKVSDEITKNIDFQVGDITKDFNKKIQKPCVVMFRNAWYHLDEKEKEKLADNLIKNLASKSLVVIGKMETKNYEKIDLMLLQKGFQPIKGSDFIKKNHYMIFEKP